MDQWAGPEGICTNFFDISTLTTSVPARLSKITGAPIVPMFCLRKAPGYYRIDFKKAFEVDPKHINWKVKTTEKSNRLLEDEILHYPEPWFWAHRRWKAKPSSVRNESVKAL